MSDPIADVFNMLDSEPDPQFVAQLRRRALAELSGTGREAVGASSPAEPPAVSIVGPDRGLEESLRRPGRRWLSIVAAAAVLAMLVGVGLIIHSGRVDRHSGHRVTPDGPFSAHLVGDMSLAGGAVAHYDANVALSQALESEEIGAEGSKDVLLTPRAALTVSTDESRLELTGAYVELFLDRTIATCVVNTDTCDPALVPGGMSTTAASQPTPGRPFTTTDSGLPSRIRVPADRAADVIERFASGTAVTGAAIVISTPGGTASSVFDSVGRHVLDCAGLPDQCMDADRSVLGAETQSSAPRREV